MSTRLWHLVPCPLAGEGARKNPRTQVGEGASSSVMRSDPLTRSNALTHLLALSREGRGHSNDDRSSRRAAAVCIAAVALFAIVATAGVSWLWVASLGPVPRGEGLAFSTLVVYRDGRLLRPYTTPDGRWRLPATRADVDPRFLAMLFAYEDRRFLSHHGVDPLALGRALLQLVTDRRLQLG